MNYSDSNQAASNKLLSWFSGLRQSEQKLMLVGTFLVTAALLWALVYKPVVTHIDNQVNIKNRLHSQLVQMQNLVRTTTKNEFVAVQPIPDGMTFSSWVDQQLRVVKLQQMVNRTEPIDENSISVWLQGVQFDLVIDWLQDIARTYAVQADQIDINVVDSSLGLTNIRMRLVK